MYTALSVAATVGVYLHCSSAGVYVHLRVGFYSNMHACALSRQENILTAENLFKNKSITLIQAQRAGL